MPWLGIGTGVVTDNELHPKYVEAPDLQAADELIAEADAHVDAAMEACVRSGMSPELQELQTASRRQDRAYAGRNALVLEHVANQYRRFGNQIRWIVGVLVVFLLVLAAAQYEQVKSNHNQTLRDQQRIKRVLQRSRFDASYMTCTRSNERHNLAVNFLAGVAKAQLGPHPTPAQKAAEYKSLQQFDTLINDLAPLTKDCSAYAHHVIKLPTGS